MSLPHSVQFTQAMASLPLRPPLSPIRQVLFSIGFPGRARFLLLPFSNADGADRATRAVLPPHGRIWHQNEAIPATRSSRPAA
jgi:hypothetical protein